MKVKRLPRPVVLGAVIICLVLYLTTQLWTSKNNTANLSYDKFKYSINPVNMCLNDKKESGEIFLLILMSSATINFSQREEQRLSLLKSSKTFELKIRTVFLLGSTHDVLITTGIYEESEKYNDILMQNFIDSYNNLTYKTLMGLKWTSVYCPQVAYVMKTDDDVYLNLDNIVTLLKMAPKQDYAVGHVFEHNQPCREKTSKWYIAEEDFPAPVYPPYLSGMAYVMTGDLAIKIWETSCLVPFIFLEDVYIGLVIDKLNIRPNTNPCFIYSNDIDYPLCAYIRACAVHMKRSESVIDKTELVVRNIKLTTCLDVICYNPYARIRNRKYNQCNIDQVIYDSSN
ncbi:putative beta-1,3-galactosyltransferase 1-like [Apostichopus japonicus]|uniref:Hexosyltransferase n=1 Tax=Stichopus japonicus TaxID=307972 RepID=A0A2G8JT14_STIJA|nr:putative beta-1,3-galactosyltransferase 1-like [Apostichopus japonicus]